MPSARELLEQADALMRKNRKRGDGDIPMLTDAVEVAIIPVAIPAAPAAAPIPAAQPVRMPSPALVAAPPPADVPLLTDAVDDVVIEFGPLPAPPAALGAFMEGDPSDWLVMDTVDPASHSITGRGPDTLAVVPPMTLKAAGSAATPPPMGSQPRERTVAPMDLPPPILRATSPQPPAPNLPAVTVQAPPAHSPAETLDTLEETAAPATMNALVTAPEAIAPEATAPEAIAPEAIAPEATVHTPAESVHAESVQAPPESTQAEAVPAPAESGWPEAVEAPQESAPEAAVHAPVPDLPEARVSAFTELAPVAIDEEHWRALAEQISMQVLQRLDLFTDSGLKEQLARRLEPIVERASAELVGEITEHVGRLVRTYVSEAIEREIVQWKRDQH